MVKCHEKTNYLDLQHKEMHKELTVESFPPLKLSATSCKLLNEGHKQYQKEETEKCLANFTLKGRSNNDSSQINCSR